MWAALLLLHGARAGEADELELDGAGELELPSAPPKHKLRLAPIRFDFRFPFRPDVGWGVITAAGVQVGRVRGTAFDLDLAYHSGRQVLQNGPFRSWSAVELGAQSYTPIGRWTGFGGVAGVRRANYVQQGQTIASGFVPSVGVRAQSSLLHARRWGLVASGRLTADLMATRFVLEDQRVERMSPLEAQLGFRFDFGHGKPQEPR
jgi:hypothetical protein